ncbi:MAG: response regulator [Sandaracinaceae bacterium]|nr:response regulator [Sandaracinaceae bacterium]
MARILVVDDSELVIRYLRRVLSAHGHVVETLESFIQLATVVRTRPPDLLILDLHMPALSGVSTGKIVRSHQAASIPILIYSSASEQELRAAAREIGAQGYVQKGADGAEVWSAVESILQPHRAAER